MANRQIFELTNQTSPTTGYVIPMQIPDGSIESVKVTIANLKAALALTKTDISLSNVDNTSDASKPVSTAQATAIAIVQSDIDTHEANTSNPHGVTKTQVGLGSVDNTSDANKPVSTAQLTALNLKAPIASPTFTGTVSGISKAMVGLGNVDNTSDTAKPVSTLQQAALNAKQDTLVSATNIKTINGSSILGSGDLSVSGGGSGTWGSITGTLSSQTDLNSALAGKQATLVSATNIKTINSQSLLGSGNINIVSSISLAKQVWVDTSGNDGTATIGDPSTPYLTIQAAITALPSTGGIVFIGTGEFEAPTTFKSNLVLQGSGKPSHDGSFTTIDGSDALTVVAPTKLVGGTIIKGKLNFVDIDNFQILDLGVDCGSNWVGLGNSPTDCIAVNAEITGDLNPPYALLKNVQIRNVALLNYQSSTLFHCLALQGCYEPIIENVSTYFGFAGIVIKCIGAIVNNVFVHGHSYYGIIIKTNTYAYCKDIILSNFTCRSINTNDGAGLYFDTFEHDGTNMANVIISNGIIRGTTFGINANTNGTLQFVTVSNITIKNILNKGILFVNGFAVSIFSNVQVSNCGAECWDIATDGSTATLSIDSCGAFIGTVGFKVNGAAGSKILLRNCTGSFNSVNDAQYTGDVRGGNNYLTSVTGSITAL